jgi:EipB-like
MRGIPERSGVRAAVISLAAWRVFVASLAVAAEPVHTPDLVPYEAIYDIRLSHASSSGGPRAANGVFESRFSETCEGWDTKTHTVMNLTFSNGRDFTNENFFSSLEAKNGRDFTFASLTLKNGKTVQAYKGSATLSRRGGRAKFELPPPEGKKSGRTMSVPLPAGTLFPAADFRALLDSAQKGAPLFRRVVLSGTTPVGPRVISTALGAPTVDGPQEAAENIDGALLNLPAWRMGEATFNLNQKRDVPNSEMFMQLHKSGVMESFEQNFQDFEIEGTLRRLRRLDAPDCSKP